MTQHAAAAVQQWAAQQAHPLEDAQGTWPGWQGVCCHAALPAWPHRN
jgi:hypothetical protein